MIRPPTRSTLFPYTTLFRSVLGLTTWLWRQKTGLKGFEPLHDETKTRCLTAWLQPKNGATDGFRTHARSEEHTSELQSRGQLVCRLLLVKKKHPYVPTETSE